MKRVDKAMFCDHANECPHVCTCREDCGCQYVMCNVQDSGTKINLRELQKNGGKVVIWSFLSKNGKDALVSVYRHLSLDLVITRLMCRVTKDEEEAHTLSHDESLLADPTFLDFLREVRRLTPIAAVMEG